MDLVSGISELEEFGRLTQQLSQAQVVRSEQQDLQIFSVLIQNIMDNIVDASTLELCQ